MLTQLLLLVITVSNGFVCNSNASSKKKLVYNQRRIFLLLYFTTSIYSMLRTHIWNIFHLIEIPHMNFTAGKQLYEISKRQTRERESERLGEWEQNLFVWVEITTANDNRTHTNSRRNNFECIAFAESKSIVHQKHGWFFSSKNSFQSWNYFSSESLISLLKFISI